MTTGSGSPTKSKSMEDHLVPLQTSCVYYIPSLIPPSDASTYYADLHQNVAWEKTPKINRWVALYETQPSNAYRYRDAPTTKARGGEQEAGSKPISSCPTIAAIKAQVEQCYYDQTGRRVTFNTCLANYYENGTQRIGWHADREEIGRSTPIASVSLGATRTFLLRHKLNSSTDRASVEMETGSVVFMENVCQEEYVHSVPKQTEVKEGRINLTFRCKTADMPGEEEHQRRDLWLERITTDAAAAADSADPSGNGQIDLSAIDGARNVTLFGDGIRVGTATDENYDGKVRYAASCNIGTECQCAAEIMELLAAEEWEVVARPWAVAGYVACVARSGSPDTTTSEQVASKLLELRSALYVMEYHDHFVLQDVVSGGDVPVSKIDGEMLYAFYKKRLEDNPELIPSLASSSSASDNVDNAVTTFRVTTERIGDHAFKAPNVEYEMGGACSEVYAPNAKPKMTDYDVNIRIDVVTDKVMIGRQLNVDDLSKRHFLRFRNSVTVKTNVAYIMLRLADVKKGDLLVDPFCGSGTIPLEALEMTSKGLKCIGMDVQRRSAEGAEQNALAEGYGPDICEFHCADARGLRRHVPEGRLADAIVSNLPWGVRTGQKQSVHDLQQMYETFLRCSWYVLKDGGRIVMLVLRGLQVMRILRKLSGRYRILKVFIVRTTNNLPCIIVVEKVGRDLMHESVKGQLAYMSQFVNVSKEMYHAINNETIDENN